MRKRVIIGDIHGRYEAVKLIYDKEQPDDVILLGDYVDTHDMISDDKQKESLENLLTLKYSHDKGEFVMLIGNHDFHYYYDNPSIERYSGYSYARAKWATPMLKELINDETITAVYIDKTNKTIYSHAGISNTWAKTFDKNIFELNNYIKDTSKLHYFMFTYGSRYSKSGDSNENSCIWIRPWSLLNDMYTDEDNYLWTQIVGHTPCTKHIAAFVPYNNKNVSIDEGKLFLCDFLPKQYLVETIDNNGIIIKRETKNVW